MAAMEDKKRRTSIEEKSSKLITEDLIIDIISRVPQKALTRFTCVSKSWRSLICTDPYFSRLRVERTTSPDRPFLFIEREYVNESWLYYNYLIDLDSIDDGNPKPIEIHHNPFGDDYDRPCRDAKLIGWCHGLLVLQQRPSLKMAVSNPTTKEHHIVPPNPAGDANVVVCGLGYDQVHDCYKLVTNVKHEDGALELMVYDLNKGTWRSLQFGMWWKFRYEFRHNYYQLDRYSVECVDGVVYWCIDRYRELRLMLCFVLAEEEFHVVQPPHEVSYCPSMTVLDGRLGLSSMDYDPVASYQEHNIWMLDMDYDPDKRQGLSAYSWRWTMLLSISSTPLNVMLPPPYNLEPDIYLIPVCFSACKKKILYLVEESEFFWYDLENKKFRKVNNPVIGPCISGRSCVRSLVGIGTF